MTTTESIWVTNGMGSRLRDDLISPETEHAQDMYQRAVLAQDERKIRFWGNEHGRLYQADVDRARAAQGARS